jgi:hypothetical protein
VALGANIRAASPGSAAKASLDFSTILWLINIYERCTRDDIDNKGQPCIESIRYCLVNLFSGEGLVASIIEQMNIA